MKATPRLPLYRLQVISIFCLVITSTNSYSCDISSSSTPASGLNEAVQACVRNNDLNINLFGKFTNNASSTVNVYLSSGITLQGDRRSVIEPTIDPTRLFQPPPADVGNFVRDREFEYRTVLENIQIQIGGADINVKNIAFANYTIPSPVISFGIGTSHVPTQTTESTVTGNLFKNIFNNGVSQPIVKINPDFNHHSNKITWNTFYNWGNAGSTVQAIKIGEERLNHHSVGGTGDSNVTFTPWTGISWSPVTGSVDWSAVTRVHGNVFVGFFNSGDDNENNAMVPSSSQQSDVIQTYNPTVITQNCMRNSVNGISVKGHRVVANNNWIQRINGDGALYHRDGNYTKFKDNLVEHNNRGFWTWSGEHILFDNNVIRDNNTLGQINGAEHACERSLNNRPDVDPLAELPGLNCNPSSSTWDVPLRQQTSYQFSTDNVLFLKNTFARNTVGLTYNHNSANITNNYDRPKDLWFIQNRYLGGTPAFAQLNKVLGDSDTVNHRNNINFAVHSSWVGFTRPVSGNPPAVLDWNSGLFQRTGAGAHWGNLGILNSTLEGRCTRYME